MFAPVRCCFDVMFLLFASLFALSVHQAYRRDNKDFIAFHFCQRNRLLFPRIVNTVLLFELNDPSAKCNDPFQDTPPLTNRHIILATGGQQREIVARRDINLFFSTICYLG